MAWSRRAWWHPAALFGSLAWGGFVPLISLSDVGEPRIGVISDAFREPLAFEVLGISAIEFKQVQGAGLEELFAVYAVNDSFEISGSPVSGSYFLDENRITFVPLHRLQSGVTYRAVLKLSGVASVAGRSIPMIVIHCEVSVPSRIQPSVTA